MLSTYLRAGSVALLLAASAALSGATPANAANAKRIFYCGDGQGTVTVTVLNQQSIRAAVNLGGEDGSFTMTMKKSGSGFRFVKGEYEVKINSSQNSLTYTAPDYGSIGCTWGG